LWVFSELVASRVKRAAPQATVADDSDGVVAAVSDEAPATGQSMVGD
jgi:hypothetical protein